MITTMPEHKHDSHSWQLAFITIPCLMTATSSSGIFPLYSLLVTRGQWLPQVQVDMLCQGTNTICSLSHNKLYSKYLVIPITTKTTHSLTYSLTHNKLSSKYLVIGDKNNTHSLNQSLTHSKLLKMSGYRGQPQHTHSQQTVLKTSSDGTTHMLYIRTNTKHTNSQTENQNFQCNFG